MLGGVEEAVDVTFALQPPVNPPTFLLQICQPISAAIER